MVGKNPLWVAKQHGHSVQTMLEVYTAWTEGAKESDIEAIRRAMESRPTENALPSIAIQEPAQAAVSTNTDPLEVPGFATSTPLEHPRPGVTCGTKRKNTGGERGIRTLEGLLTLTPLAGVRLRPLGHLSVLGKNACGPGAYGPWGRLATRTP